MPTTSAVRPTERMRWREVARATSGGLFATGLRGRLLVALGAIALGVALGFAVQLVNGAAISEFTTGLATLAGDADLQVRGPRAGFPEMVYAAVARDAGVAIASPVIEIEARLPARDDTLALQGIDVFRAVAVTPALIGLGPDRLDTVRADAIFLSPAAQAWLGVQQGESIDFQVGLDTVRFTVAGKLALPDSRRLGVVDIAAAQEAFERLGRLTRIDVRVRPGVPVESVAARLAAQLPPGVVVETPRSSIDAVARLSRAYRVNLNVLALVALFTGGLLVYSTQALSVARRRTQFALLRSLGMTRGALIAFIGLEGAFLGAIGALAGLAGGYALAALATRAFGLDLGAGFFRGLAPSIAIDPRAAMAFGLLGVLAAVAGSLVPAREAARAAPAAALKAADMDMRWITMRDAALGWLAIVAGMACTLLPPVADLPLFGYLAIVLLLAGTLRLLPQLAATVLSHSPRPRAVAMQLALAQLRHSPGQATLSLAAIVAGVSLMASMAIMVTSFRTSLDDWLAHALPADVYLRSGSGDSAYLPSEARELVAHAPGVMRAEFLRSTSLLLAPAQPRTSLLARDIDRNDPAARLVLVGPHVVPGAGDPPPAWISEPLADRLHLAAGDRLTLPLANRRIPFTVAGVWRDYVRQQGAIVMERSTYRELTGDDAVTDAALWLEAGTRIDDLKRELQTRLPNSDRLQLETPNELRRISLRVFDRTFAVTYALEAVAVLIGLVGLSSAFGGLVLARMREFGMLRHLGMTRRQIGAMLAVEGFALGGIGQVAGLGLGFVIALILIHVVNRQSFHWSMELNIPWLPLSLLVVSLLALCTLTGWMAARRVMSRDVVQAVKEDW